MTKATWRISTLMALLVAFLPLEVGAADIYVPDDYPAIQGAIEAAQPGDTVIVRPGVYSEWIDFLGKAITVKSSHGPLLTTIQSPDPRVARAVVRFETGESPDSVLDGFTITGGLGELWYQVVQGGGIFCLSSPTIINNVIRNNGIEHTPGGFYWPELGGGIFVFGDPVIRGNVVSDNVAESGGGIMVESGAPIIENNRITGNQATTRGGGARLHASWFDNAVLNNNVIMGNRAGTRGGGVYLYTRLAWPSMNNTIVENHAGSDGGGIWSGNVYVYNSIVRDNSAPSGPQFSSSSVRAHHCNVEGGWTNGPGNIDAPPGFVDVAAGDVHLRYDSPCRDAGTSSFGVVLPARDFEGDPRVAGFAVDIGADEFHPHLYYRRGYLDNREIDVVVVASPGTPSVTLAGSLQVQDPPLTTPFGDLHLQPPFFLAAPLGPVPANGILAITTTYPGSWVAGDRFYFQALVGPAAPGSVLSNLMTLTVAPAP